MSLPTASASISDRHTVSPYLTRPLRTHAQAKAEIAEKKARIEAATPFVPWICSNNGIRFEQSRIAA